MCTRYVIEETSKEILKLDQKEQRYWKIMKVQREGLFSLYHDRFQWTPGTNRARTILHRGIGGRERFNITVNVQECQRSHGNIGIHVYKTQAESDKNYRDIGMRRTVPVYAHRIYKTQEESDKNYMDIGMIIIVPVYAHRKHFVQADQKQALFTQVTIRQQDWDHIVEPRIKQAKQIKESHVLL